MAAASTEVRVLPENPHCGEVADILKAQLAPGGSLLGCLSVRGRLELWDQADRESSAATVEGSFSDFCWEEVQAHARGGAARLLAVGAQCHLKLLEVNTERGSPISLLWDSSADQLLEALREQDHDVCEQQSLLVLSFAAGRCFVLLNTDWLLQLQWRPAEAELQTTSCCRIQLSDDSRHTSVDRCISRETLFILSTSGLISVYHVSDGSLLATIDLLSYLKSWPVEDELSLTASSLSSSSFCLLQVSADLSTAVAVTQSHTAVAVDLNHYFRSFPNHLYCVVPVSRPPLQPQQADDQDSVSSCGRCLISLGLNFIPERSWEAHLAYLYTKAQQIPTNSSSPSSWSSSLPHLKSHQAVFSAHSRVPHGGTTVSFSVPESSIPSLLAVSEFSAQLTFVTPGNQPNTAAFWDLESGRVSYHQTCGEAAPVQRCGERQHQLFLKKAGLFQVLFSVSQQDLLIRLMLFGSASTVDAVCHLNSWGRCSIPIHSLQAGLKNRQLDTVEFFLKSKENVLKAADQPAPADLTHDEDEGVRSCVNVLDRYVTELRSYMKKFPWPAGGNTSSSVDTDTEDEWAGLPTEELVRLSILTNQIPRAQAVLRRQNYPEQDLSALRMEGLRQVFSCLQRRDLQTACTLLINMGFSVKEQLSSICRYTDDKDLREFMVKELSEQGFLPEEELQGVAFIREMEKLGSLPGSHHTTKTSSQRWLQMILREPPAGVEVLTELVGPKRSEEEGSLWRNLRLDWARNWDKSCQTAITLSRRQHSDLSSCESAVLWRYLTSLHDHRVLSWISGKGQTSGSPRWPELAPEVVNNNTMCSTYMRENILDLLARRSVFIPDELADFEQLLWRLAQGGGVMASTPPVPQYRSPLSLDFHSLFITFCQDHNLQYLLYTYLQHYRLTPRNCHLLTDQRMSENQPWCEMLVKIQEITRDLTDPGLVFQASLTSAQVLLPGSQASLSSLLLEGHSLLALATIMFAPGGIDELIVHGQRSGRSERTVDPQVLKMALAPYPKLKVALFPGGPRGHSPSSDITVYHLLQSLHPLDPSRLFGWQAANTFNSTESSELPHFSSPHLVNRFALVENLDFLYYLRHGRPSFAFATFLIQQLNGCSDIRPRLQQVRQQVYHLALQCFNMAPVVSACVCFCELLGICSLNLRVDVRALNAILQHWSRHHGIGTPSRYLHMLVSKGVKLVEAEPKVAEELIGDLEAAVMDQLEQKGIGSDGHFIHFLLFVQLHNFPPQQVRALAAGFGPTLQAHLNLALQDLQVDNKRSRCGSEEPPESLRSTEHSSIQKPITELFQVLLQSLEEAAPSWFLLQEALVQRSPTLAVMAACQQGAELLACLCVWVLTSVDDITASEATSHLDEGPEHHHWTLHDLSVIWRTLLGRGCVRPLLRGFELFQRDCPLLLVLRMFELCCEYRNFSEAKVNLVDFQKTLLTLRTSSPPPSGGLPLQWVETQASVLLLSMLQRCSSQFDLHRLLQLLADVDKLLKSNASVQQEEFQAIVEALQARGRYSQARQVAQLAGLSIQQLLLSQLLQEVNSQRSKRQWGRLETRVTFWKKCHEQLKSDSTEAELAHQFFQSQAELDEWSKSDELLDIQERCLLLCLTAHWLSQLSPVPAKQLESLEKKLWLFRVRCHILAINIEKASVFKLPPPPITPGMNMYEALMKEFSMDNVSCLNTDTCLRLEGLPGPSDEPTLDPSLSPEERTVLTTLIGQVLDEGSIHEASRACRYFSLYHQDLWLVLHCRGLACGELKPESTEEVSEAPPGKSIKPSSSVSSLLSFSMLVFPNDDVTAQLQKLADQCCHGNSYCKRVLGLYQLSKELQCSFSQMCSEEPGSILEKLLLLEQPERFRKAQTFIRAQGLSSDSVAELVSSAVVQALTLSNQELQPVVELLIVAHDCFSLTCNMEGIVRVLQAARHLSHAHLAPGEHFSLLVRLLTGIGRYNEMTYVFDLLHQNHRFEILLRKNVDIDRRQSSGLKTALLDYLKRCLPADSEKHNMVALCFSMRREIGENHEMAARTQLKMIESQAWVVTPELKSSLVKVLGLLTDAAESFSKDACVRQANRCVRTAKLVALQLHLLEQDSHLRVINLQPAELLNTIMFAAALLSGWLQVV
ncbi:hypothetical protein fugu_011922 [Takifugu bimaculatus]|uniref:Spatacsin C-terminal domain-containing protein n=1 Tax=Takifugu bimaculatus TaxID=433685 RepID=A0A4Z2C920_9TELE|nr:hypothetical protein fugu_011922 [Takifugu bimaculatus]